MWAQDNEIAKPSVTKLSFLGPDLTSKPSMSFLNTTFENVSFELASEFKREEETVPREEVIESVSDNEKDVSEVEITLEVQDLERLVDSTDYEIKTEPEILDPVNHQKAKIDSDKSCELESIGHVNTAEQPDKLDKKKRRTTSQKRKWPEDPADCDICGTHYTTKRSYQRHYKIVHELRSQDCKHCDKQFKWPGKLLEHTKLVHLGIQRKTYPCDQCDKVWTASRSLKQHMAREHPPPGCESCKVSFHDMEGLQEHIRVEHLQKYCNN